MKKSLMIAAMLLAMALMVSGTVWAQESATLIIGGTNDISATGDFESSGVITMTGADLNDVAVFSSLPTYTVRVYEGDFYSEGWHFQLQQTTQFTGTGDVAGVNLGYLDFDPAGAGIARTGGTTLVTVPSLGATSGSLSTARAALVSGTTSRSGIGLFTYTPVQSQFTLDIPADVPAGTYEGAITATLIKTP